MKRAFLAILILGTGTTVFCAFHNAVGKIQRESALHEAAWQTQTQQLAELHFEQQDLVDLLGETKQLLAGQLPVPALTALEEKVISGAVLTNLSATESEELLAELGFNWNTTGDYIMVSKKSLDGISFDGMKGVKLTTAAIGTLAITPDEQAAIETMTRQLGATRAVWAREHVRRTEPSGDVLAQYTLPADAEFSQGQMAMFTNCIFGVLGSQRGQWLQEHSLQWMMDSGLVTGPDLSKVPAEFQAILPLSDHLNQPTVLTLHRYQAGNDWGINYDLQQAGNGMSTTVNPWQPFPAPFLAIFTGGWKELAAREGFELPKEFNSH
jgi:hypothetical protein